MLVGEVLNGRPIIYNDVVYEEKEHLDHMKVTFKKKLMNLNIFNFFVLI